MSGRCLSHSLDYRRKELQCGPRVKHLITTIYSRQPGWDKPCCCCSSHTEARHALLWKMIPRLEYLRKKRKGTSFHGSYRKQHVLANSTSVERFSQIYKRKTKWNLMKPGCSVESFASQRFSSWAIFDPTDTKEHDRLKTDATTSVVCLGCFRLLSDFRKMFSREERLTSALHKSRSSHPKHEQFGS
jgi:hypothetical protein